MVNEQYAPSLYSGRCDISITVDQDLKKAMKDNEKFLEIVKDSSLINIDFFLGNSSKNILEHCSREYQNNENLLILVPSSLSGEISAPNNVPCNEHVKILGPDLFSTFMDLDDKTKQYFKEILLLANDATWKGEEYKEELQQIARKKLNVPIDVIERSKEKFREFVQNRENLMQNSGKIKKGLEFWLR